MLLAGSCQKEALNPVSDGDVAVKLSIELPAQVQTKAMSKAENTDIVYYEIWNSDWTKQLYPIESEGNTAYASAAVSGRTATINLTLISAQTYNFIFWAQTEDCGAYDVSDLKNVKVDYNVIGAAGNQDKFDAYYAVKTFKVDRALNETVVLYRPFAQLNFGADVMETTLGDVTVESTSVTVNRLATVFNTISGVGEKEIVDVVFDATDIATNEALETNGHSYTWVTMDYMLMMGDQDVVEVGATFNVGMDYPVEYTVDNVPLKKNYRTNIVGDLFTSGAVLNIYVEPEFNQPDEIVGPGNVIVTNVYSVATAAELQTVLNEKVAPEKTVIKFAADLVGDVTVKQAAGKNIVLDGCGYKYDGTITINGDARDNGAETLTFTNINFETTTDGITFISSPSKINGRYSYSHNVTIEGCTFSGNHTNGSASLTGTYNLKMRDCVANNMHSLLQVQSCGTAVLVEDVTVNNGKNGVSFGNTAYPTLLNSEINVSGYGVRGDADASRGRLVIENTTVSAEKPVIIRKVKTAGYSVALEETLLDTDAEYDVVFTQGDDAEAYVAPAVSFTVTGAENYNVFPF